MGNLGDWKPIKGELAELRFHHDSGIRVYFSKQKDGRIILLLAGGIKDTQARDIEKALNLLEEWKHEHE